MRKATTELKLKLPSNESLIVCYRLLATSPMLVHCFGQKSFTEMLEKMVGRRADGTPLDKAREPKDLEAEFQNAIAKNQKGEHAIPTRWVKAGMLTAASAGNKAINGSALRRGAFVLGFTVPILHQDGGSKFSNPKKQIDIVRVGTWSNRVPDVRARPRYDEWMIEVAIRVYPTQISVEHVSWALDAMGKLVGLGDYRPEKNGAYGCFEIEPISDSKYNSIMKACASPEVELVVPDALQTAMREHGVSLKDALDERNAQAGGRGAKAGKNGARGKKSNGVDAGDEQHPDVE